MNALDISRRLWRVWQRNFTVYLRTWKINFVPPLLEPVFYLFAFGAGLGVMIEKVSVGGVDVPYIIFIAPGLLAVAVMQNAFFENTYASFVRMYYQKTFDAILATPLSIGDVIAGEIFWGATKSVIAAVLMTLALVPLKLAPWQLFLAAVPLALLGGLAFGSLGMYFTAITPTIEVFNIPVFLFITPMFLFSGTFFPLENLPPWANYVAQAFPLTHMVILFRGVALGGESLKMLASVAYLVVFTCIFFPLGVARMRRRLLR